MRGAPVISVISSIRLLVLVFEIAADTYNVITGEDHRSMVDFFSPSRDSADE